MKKKNFFKKIMFIVFALAMVTSFASFNHVASADVSSYQENKLNLNVKSAIAIDSKTGQILYAKNADKKLPIASMTKLITVYLTLDAIKNSKLTWQTKVKPTNAIVKVANNSEYSNVPLKKGNSYTVKKLYEATLIESANGAAMCLAQAVSGSQVTFVNKMRAQLKKWHINDAKIYTVCGLPNGNVGKAAYPGVNKNVENTMSAKDMAIIGQHLLTAFPEVIKTTKKAHLAFKDTNKVTKMTNFNWMLKGLSQYSPELKVDGLKTGTTDAAGACFIGTVKRGAARIITVVMGARHLDGTDPSRFIQTKKLMNWIFANYTPVILKAGTDFNNAKKVDVPNGKSLTLPIGIKDKTVVWDLVDGVHINATLTKKEVQAPIKMGQKVTNYIFRSGSNKLISIEDENGMRIPAQALENNNEVNIFVKFWRWITGVR